MMTVYVELRSTTSQLRAVEIPDSEDLRAIGTNDLLELVFRYGQNDFQPRPMPSVSVGDVVRLYGKRYRVAVVGFKELPEGGDR